MCVVVRGSKVCQELKELTFSNFLSVSIILKKCTFEVRTNNSFGFFLIVVYYIFYIVIYITLHILFIDYSQRTSG